MTLRCFLMLGICILSSITRCSARTTVGNNRQIQCHNCSEAWTIQECDGVKTCSPGEVCYLQFTESPGFMLFGKINVYDGGCIQPSKCHDVALTSLEPGKIFSLNKVLCGECCDGMKCNKYLCNNHSKVYLVCMRHTVQYKKQTKNLCSYESRKNVAMFPYVNPISLAAHLDGITSTSTSSSSSSTTSKTTTTTTSTTTRPHAVTTIGSIKPVLCEVCSGGICGFIPGNDPVVQCPDGQPFCMNTVVNSDTGAKNYTKRCASTSECKIKWWNESSDKVTCTDYQPQRLNYFPFICHYCCVTDHCNKDIFPAPGTLFEGSS